MRIMTGTVDLSATSRRRNGSQHLTAFTARPEGDGPWPSVVLVMEIFGVNDDMRAHAERIAGWGYRVVVPDLYSDGGARRCLVATMRAMVSGHGRAFTDIETARQWALGQPGATDKVGIIGFCMGGGFALLTGDRDRYDALSANYGRVPDDVTRACPVVGSYGGRDRQNPGAAEKLRVKLADAGVPQDVVEYPESGHAFLNESTPGPAALAPLWHVGGFGGPDADRADAWRRIEAWFAEHLSPEAVARG